MSHAEAVGFRDMVRFGFGTAIPSLVLLSALIIAGFVAAGADVGPGITVAFTVAFLLAVALEMFRRYVLTAGGGAVTAFRAVIWGVLLAAVPVTVSLGLGVLTHCYGQRCDALSSYMLEFMFVCCLCILPMVPLGFFLLRDAAWLKAVR